MPAVRVDNGSVHAYSVRSSDASSVGSGARSHSGSTVYSWRGDAASPVVEGAREFEASGGSPEAPARLADALKRPGDFAPGHIRALMEKVVDVDGDAAPAADQGAFREHDLHHHAYSGQAAAPQWDRDAWHHPQDAMAGPHTQAHAYAPAQATAAGQQRRTERGGSGWQEPTGRSGEGFGTLRFVRSQQSDADGHATSSVLQERMRRSNPGVVDAMYSRRWEWGPQWGRGTGGAGASLPQGAGPGQQSDPTAGAGAAGYRPAVDASWAPNDDGPDHGMHDGHDLEGMDDRELEMLLEGGADDLLDGDLEAFLPKHSPDADGPEGEGHR